ncbi:MAG: hypothetical protein HQL05_13745 [Nitrospirae bacterium]|nr:hypothetical protein [Nitrospirota bacterium]
MKKVVLPLIILMFALGAASVMYAADEVSSGSVLLIPDGETKITFGGEFRFRGLFAHNLTDQLDNKYYNAGMKQVEDDHTAYYDSHVKLNINAKIGNEVEGLLEIESGTDKVDGWRWGTASGATGIYPNGNAKSGDVRIRQAWLLYRNGLYGLQIGHQLWYLGNRLFFNHKKFGDDGIRVIVDPSKELNIEVSTIKLSEQDLNHPDDADAYIAALKYTSGDLKAEADVTYINDQGFSALFADYSHGHIWNFGLRADYTVGQVTLRGDIELQAGRLDGVLSVDDATVKGWAGLAAVDYKTVAGSLPVVLTLETVYGSGKSTQDDSKDFKTFITLLGVEPHYTFVYDYYLKTAAGKTSTGIANTFYIKGGASANLLKDIDGELYVYTLKAAKKVALNGADPSTDLGVEVDGKLIYRMSKNLIYCIEGGYMFTGKAYDTVTVPSPTRETHHSNAYALRNRIQLNF